MNLYEINQVNVSNNVITVESILQKLKSYFRGEKSINFPTDREVILFELNSLYEHLLSPSNSDVISSKEIVLFFNKTCYQWNRYLELSLKILQVLVALQELQRKIPANMTAVILLPGGVKIVMKALKCHISNYHIIKCSLQLIESISCISILPPSVYCEDSKYSSQYIIQAMLHEGVGYCIPKLLIYISMHLEDVWVVSICLKWFHFVINSTPSDYICKIVSYDDWMAITALTKIIEYSSENCLKEILFCTISLSAVHLNVAARLYTSGCLSSLQQKLSNFQEDLTDCNVNGLDDGYANLLKINTESGNDIDQIILFLDQLIISKNKQIEKNLVPFSDDLESVASCDNIPNLNNNGNFSENNFYNFSNTLSQQQLFIKAANKRLSIHLPTFSPSHSSIPSPKVAVTINTYPSIDRNTSSKSSRPNSRKQQLQPIMKSSSQKTETQSYTVTSVKKLSLNIPKIEESYNVHSPKSKSPHSPATTSSKLLTSPFGQPVNAYSFKATVYDPEKQFIPKVLGGAESASPKGKQKFNVTSALTSPTKNSLNSMAKNLLYRGLTSKGYNSPYSANSINSKQNIPLKPLVTRIQSNENSKQHIFKSILNDPTVNDDNSLSFSQKLNTLISTVREETSSFKEIL